MQLCMFGPCVAGHDSGSCQSGSPPGLRNCILAAEDDCTAMHACVAGNDTGSSMRERPRTTSEPVGRSRPTSCYDGELRVSLDAVALDGTIADGLDILFHADGTMTGTISGVGFADPYGTEPASTEVVVDGVWPLDCLNAAYPAEMDLTDGSVATFACRGGELSYTITPRE